MGIREGGYQRANNDLWVFDRNIALQKTAMDNEIIKINAKVYDKPAEILKAKQDYAGILEGFKVAMETMKVDYADKVTAEDIVEMDDIKARADIEIGKLNLP